VFENPLGVGTGGPAAQELTSSQFTQDINLCVIKVFIQSQIVPILAFTPQLDD